MKGGAFCGVALLVSLAACDIFCPDDYRLPALPGHYVSAVAAPACRDSVLPPTASDPEQHTMTLSTDRRTIQETFVRNGKTYVLEYDVTGIGSTTIQLSEGGPRAPPRPPQFACAAPACIVLARMP